MINNGYNIFRKFTDFSKHQLERINRKGKQRGIRLMRITVKVGYLLRYDYFVSSLYESFNI